MRKLKSASCQWLEVSSVEWLNFVEDALYNGFHSIAEKVHVICVKHKSSPACVVLRLFLSLAILLIFLIESDHPNITYVRTYIQQLVLVQSFGLKSHLVFPHAPYR